MEKFKLGSFKAKISFKYFKKIVPTDIGNSASENENELSAEQIGSSGIPVVDHYI